MGRNKGYAFEKETEALFMALEDQKQTQPLHTRSRRQPASGAMESAKGDVVSNLSFLTDFGQFMVECKDRKTARGDGKSVSIKKDELDKSRFEARADMKHPLFAFKVKQPVGGDRTPIFKEDPEDPMGLRWMAMPFMTFRLLLEHLRDLTREVEELKSQVKGPRVGGPSLCADCRKCRRELDAAVDRVRKVMGG